MGEGFRRVPGARGRLPGWSASGNGAAGTVDLGSVPCPVAYFLKWAS